jgi:hypothetical protein
MSDRRKPRGLARFREREVTRITKAVRIAGGGKVTLDPATGCFTIVVASETTPTDMPSINPWDSIRAEDSKRPPRFCSWNIDRHGKRRVRFRRRGVTAYLTGIPWSEDFLRQYARAMEGVQAQAGNVGAGRTKPGSIDALVVSYLKSVDFAALKPTTKAVRMRIIEREIRIPHGDKPVRLLGRGHVKNIIGAKVNTPEAGNNLLKILRTLLAHAVDVGMIEIPHSGHQGISHKH